MHPQKRGTAVSPVKTLCSVMRMTNCQQGMQRRGTIQPVRGACGVLRLFEGAHMQYMRLCQKQQCKYTSHAYGTRSYVLPHLLLVVHVPDVHIYAARLICCQPGV